jgi:hypothetical protein
VTGTIAPPPWAESLLMLVLSRDAFESVSGDLLEEYRDSVRPERGAARADRWYVAQVLGFVWRSALPWAPLLAGGFLVRTALDWRLPPSDFSTRSLVTTYLALGILLCAGLSASWRAGSVRAGLFGGVVAAALAAPISLLGAAVLLAVWHDPATLAAVEGSGGLAEVFVLPWMAIVPAAVVGTAGGLVGATASRLRPRRSGPDRQPG